MIWHRAREDHGSAPQAGFVIDAFTGPHLFSGQMLTAGQDL
jgi:hypothetical protein